MVSDSNFFFKQTNLCRVFGNGKLPKPTTSSWEILGETVMEPVLILTCQLVSSLGGKRATRLSTYTGQLRQSVCTRALKTQIQASPES